MDDCTQCDDRVQYDNWAHVRQFGNLPKRGWGKVWVWMRHSWGTKLKFRGKGWGTIKLMTFNCLGQSLGMVGARLGHKTEIPVARLRADARCKVATISCEIVFQMMK